MMREISPVPIQGSDFCCVLHALYRFTVWMGLLGGEKIENSALYDKTRRLSALLALRAALLACAAGSTASSARPPPPALAPTSYKVTGKYPNMFHPTILGLAYGEILQCADP